MNDKRRRVRGKLLASGLVLLALSAAAFLAPWLSPYSPSEQDLLASRQSPSSDHWLGTDVLGRDVPADAPDQAAYGQQFLQRDAIRSAARPFNIVRNSAGTLDRAIHACSGGAVDVRIA